jgi:hypothetical protein
LHQGSDDGQTTGFLGILRPMYYVSVVDGPRFGDEIQVKKFGLLAGPYETHFPDEPSTLAKFRQFIDFIST